VLIVKNYTGDRLNFGLAAELARAEGIPVEVVVVADDVALRATVPPDRRRGIAGTVLIHKVAGAAAAAGKSVVEVAVLARAAAENLGTMGVALGACTVPAAGRPGFEIGETEIELGLGIHGEQGVERGPMQPADALVDRILATIVEDRGLRSGEHVVLMVNGLGGTPPMELAIVARRALSVLRGKGIIVDRAWAGVFLSALEMPGVSLSVLRVDTPRLALLDSHAEAPAWPGPGRIEPSRHVLAGAPEPLPEPPMPPGPLAAALKQGALAVAAALEAAEAHLTDLDSRAGDGDLGISMLRGAEALRALPEGAWADPPTAFEAMAGTLRRALAGSSGPFYATALLRAARALPVAPTPQDWAEAFRQGVASIGELGGAKPGDRTMLDALHPAVEAFATGGMKAAALAAEEGVAATASMIPRLGRASYLGARAVGAPDAGAAAVAIWLRALAGPRS
jgi:dihydroxyacetone kinase